MKYWKYLNYVLRHRWFVFVECFKVGLYRQGLTHDICKFLPSQFIPYARFFYGTDKNPRNSTGYYKPVNTGNMPFELAWTDHIHRSKHHWQWWVRCNDDGRLAILDMPIKYALEMVCDWKGAGVAQGFKRKDDCKNWYLKNKGKMKLSKDTRNWIETYLLSTPTGEGEKP